MYYFIPKLCTENPTSRRTIIFLFKSKPNINELVPAAQFPRILCNVISENVISCVISLCLYTNYIINNIIYVDRLKIDVYVFNIFSNHFAF